MSVGAVGRVFDWSQERGTVSVHFSMSAEISLAVSENNDTLCSGGIRLGKEILFVPERVPIRHNVKHLGLQGHVWSEGLIYATGKEGKGFYVIVPHDRLGAGPGWIMLLDRNFRIRNMRNIREEIRSEALL